MSWFTYSHIRTAPNDITALCRPPAMPHGSSWIEEKVAEIDLHPPFIDELASSPGGVRF